MKDLEIENKMPTAITPESNEKEIKKEDIDLLLDNVSNGYLSLAGLLISRMEILEILAPVVDPQLLSNLEAKCSGLTVNMQSLEKDLDELKSEREAIENLLNLKNSSDEDIVKKAELELLPKFESLIYRTGDISKAIESLSEYYFINIQATIDSLESNARQKHTELNEALNASSKAKEGEVDGNKQ